MLEPLKRYLTAPQLSEFSAGTVLRAAFAAVFMLQVVLACVVALVVRLIAAGTTFHPSPVLTWTLVGFGLFEVVFAALVSAKMAANKGRRAALTTALLTATLYGSVSWFLALALATEQRGAALYVLLLLLAMGYAFGFLGLARLAKSAAAEQLVAPTRLD